MSVVSFAVFCGIQVVTDTTVTHSSVNLLSKPSRPSQDEHHHWDVSRSGRSCVSYSETMANIQTHDVSQDLNVIQEQECVVDQIELHSWLMKLIVLHLQLLSLWGSYCSFFNVTFYSRFILQMSRVKFSVTSLRWCVNFQWTVTQTDRRTLTWNSAALHVRRVKYQSNLQDADGIMRSQRPQARAGSVVP